LRPADARAVARTLGWCYGHDVPIVPRGGGTGLAGGAAPLLGGVVVSLERLRRVLAIEPGLWRLSVEAGVRTADVARLARESGLMFAPDPGAAEQSQIGGNVATNAGGPHAFKYGRTGAFVSGLEVALAPGELAQLGGAGWREAAGYDLTGLLVGSEGTLGIVTAVELRLLPARAGALALVVFTDDLQSAQSALLAILSSDARPAVLEFVDARAFQAAAATFPGEPPRGAASAARHAGPVLLLELDGPEVQRDRERGELEEALGDAEGLSVESVPPAPLWRWRDGMNGVVAGVRGGKVSEDIRVPRERLAEALEAVYAIGAELSLQACAWGHAGDGIVHATFLVDPATGDELERGLRAGERALELALALGGSITGEHGVGWVKRRFLAAQLGPAATAAHERVKRALDPRGLLNPGKNQPAVEDGGERAGSAGTRVPPVAGGGPG
jgi:glycolate dehydrogenase FAD-linked subunit